MKNVNKGRGPLVDGRRLRTLLDHVFQKNLAKEADGQRGTPVCIWGKHGIGKTAMVEAYALSQDPPWKFAYCAPAQFEEMGDLHGLPTRVSPPDGDPYTAFLPPEWVPTEAGPGILLLDDINRADDRILRGLMQLLQKYEMYSWSLPKGWQIVCTANPEDAAYSVTHMDEAMVTRLLHVTMSFDVKAWVQWAEATGVDPRGISFVESYPECISQGAVTPRALCQFFDLLRDMPVNEENLGLVRALGRTCLDRDTISAFVAHTYEPNDKPLTAEELLFTEDFSVVVRRLEAEMKGIGRQARLDRLGVTFHRLQALLEEASYKPEAHHLENLISLLTLTCLPRDLCGSVYAVLKKDDRSIYDSVIDHGGVQMRMMMFGLNHA